MSKRPTPEAEAAAASAGQVEARVLTGCAFGAANDVVLLSADEAAAGVTDGLLDTTVEAVAYAKSEG